MYFLSELSHLLRGIAARWHAEDVAVERHVDGSQQLPPVGARDTRVNARQRRHRERRRENHKK